MFGSVQGGEEKGGKAAGTDGVLVEILKKEGISNLA